MKKGLIKQFVVVAVTLAMIVTFFPVNVINADAATKKFRIPDFEQKTIYIRKGARQKITLSPKKKGAKLTWSSGDKNTVSVSKKGYIRGVSEGSTKLSVKIRIPKEKINTTRKAVVKVCDKTNVSDSKHLNTALKRNAYNTITLQSDDKTDIMIPLGSYTNTDLFVDAPNADITNLGKFKTITINRIASDTWNEVAQGNTIVFNAPTGHIVIPAGANLSELRLAAPSDNLKVDIEGNVAKVVVDSESKIDLNVKGTVSQLDVNKKSEVNIKGSSEKIIPVKASEESKGSSISSGVKVDVTAASDLQVDLAKGAEGSTVKTDDSSAMVEVKNNTTASVSVEKNDGQSASVGAGQQVATDTMNVENNPDATSEKTPSAGSGSDGASAGTSGGSVAGGSSSSGGSSSGSSGGTVAPDPGTSASGDASDPTASGDATKRVKKIHKFVFRYYDNTEVDAGIAGTKLKTFDEMKSKLPNEVVGYPEEGNPIKIPITGWNDSVYNPTTATAGDYMVTAKLGEAKKPYELETGVSAPQIKIHVMADKEVVVPIRERDKYKGKFTITETYALSDKIVVQLKYTGIKAKRIRPSIKYYNKDGYPVDQFYTSLGGINIAPNQTKGFIFNKPGNDGGKYDCFIIEPYAYSTTDDESMIKSNVAINSVNLFGVACSSTGSAIYVEPNEITDENTGLFVCRAEIINNSSATINSLHYLVYFWKDNKLLDVQSGGIYGRNIYGHEERKIEVPYNNDYFTTDSSYVNGNWVYKYSGKTYPESERPNRVSFEINDISILQ